MLLPAILGLAGMAAQPSNLAPAVSDYAEQASGWLLEGKNLPPDYRVRLRRMPPAERLQVLIFLRRSGLLVGQPWSLDDILRPAESSEEASE
ncbi:hypothetical protein [Paracoccus sp. (in: a-proteobacteria)]|uniref:hypothetical protein n=1 Tax=Paracoccus sp. TaxID=267 RepID=UPI003A8977FF